MAEPTADPYDVLPEPLRTIAREEARSEARTGKLGGSALLLGGVGLGGYLAYYVLRHTASRGGFSLRTDELVALAIAVILMVIGAAWLRMSLQPDTRIQAFHRPGNGIASFVRVIGQSGRRVKIVMTDGTIVFWRLTPTYAVRVDEAAERATLDAVAALQRELARR